MEVDLPAVLKVEMLNQDNFLIYADDDDKLPDGFSCLDIFKYCSVAGHYEIKRGDSDAVCVSRISEEMYKDIIDEKYRTVRHYSEFSALIELPYDYSYLLELIESKKTMLGVSHTHNPYVPIPSWYHSFLSGDKLEGFEFKAKGLEFISDELQGDLRMLPNVDEGDYWDLLRKFL